MSAVILKFPAARDRGAEAVRKESADAAPLNERVEQRLDRIACLLAKRAIERRREVESRFGMADETETLVARLEEISQSVVGIAPTLKKRIRRLLRVQP